MATDTRPALSVPAASGETLNRTVIAQQFDRLLAANGAALSRLAASYTDTAGDRDDLT